MATSQEILEILKREIIPQFTNRSLEELSDKSKIKFFIRGNPFIMNFATACVRRFPSLTNHNLSVSIINDDIETFGDLIEKI
jgi:hypothetical protein